MKKAIAPHIKVQPKNGKIATKLTAPKTGTKINNPIMAIIIKPITQGFRHLLQDLKKLFIIKF